MKVSLAAERWLSTQGHLAPSTLASYERDLKHVHRLWGHRSVRSLRTIHISEAIRELSPSKQRRVLGVLRLVLDQHREPNPARQVKVKGQQMRTIRKAPSVVDVEQLAEAMPEHGTRVLALAATGLRYGEMCALTEAAIDRERQLVRVLQAQCPSTLAFREPKSKSGVRNLVTLSLWPEALDGPWPFGPYHGSAFNKYWTQARRATGLTWRVHDMRHFYATHLLREGVPIATVSEWLGHSSPTTTMTVYAGFLDEDYSHWAARL